MGLFQTATGPRAVLAGPQDGERRCIVGRLHINAEGIRFESVSTASRTSAGDPALFTRANNGWAEGLHPLDRFVKNTYEILSPLYELTAQMPLTEHEFLTTDRKVQRTRFGGGNNAVEVIVNASAADCHYRSTEGGSIALPPFGFLVEAPTFVAFCARSWNGLRYDVPALFTLRSLDGRPLSRSRKLRIYHGFGDDRVRVGSTTRSVKKEATVASR